MPFQASQLPGRHMKMVRAQVAGKIDHPLALFEPDAEVLEDRCLLAPEAPIEERGMCNM